MSLLRYCLGMLVAFGIASAGAQPAAPGPADVRPAHPPIAPGLLGKLKKGGYLLFFRHGLTPSYDDPGGGAELGNCSTQRNLSKEGIAQTRAMGEAFRDLDIPIGIVRSSPYCRAMDSAWHAFGRAERDMNLRLSGTVIAVDTAEAKRYRVMRNLAKILPLPGTNSVFMSHGSAGEVFGVGFLDEGEAAIVKPDGKGGWVYIARVKSDQWRER